MFKLAISGSNGRIGSEVRNLASASTIFQVVANIDRSSSEAKNTYQNLQDAIEDLGSIDVLIDFTSADASMDFAEKCAANGISHVCGSTGFSSEQIAKIKALAKDTRIFLSPNMSLGISVIKALCKKASIALGGAFDVEILEAHHNNKKDSPSGTALMIGDAIAETKNASREIFNLNRNTSGARKDGEIGFASIRGGSLPGEHTVFFIGESEQISISHEAFDKKIFAQGALSAAKWLLTKNAGKLYNMDDMVDFN